jgi:hypothetical protein
MTDVNECKYGCGTCRRYLDGDCGNHIGTGSRCVYGNGRGVTAEDVKAGSVKIECWNCTDSGHCFMAVGEYTRWNGRCIHQR